MKTFKRYIPLFIVIFIGVIIYIALPENGSKATQTILYSLKEMALIIPPIFILLGFLDVFIPRETIMKYMGEKSGVKGVLLSIVLGSAAAGPLYAAFPIASVFMKKGVKFSNIMLFIGAWSTTKIPMFLFEMTSLGVKFALIRLGLSIVGIFVIALVLNKVITPEEQKKIYQMNI
ncbi:MAG: permease [Candidatus Izemoplasmatales bacterium]|jgi:uncharacterized membrane protein YraQ (UPF0718 family)|nr:permease [Candidatus Izemoplasmatales bacterium]